MRNTTKLTEEYIRRIVRESFEEAMADNNHIYTEREMKWLYDNQDKLSPIQQKVLNAGMWVRAMQANYHGYAEGWPNISVMNGEIFYFDKNGDMEKVP